MSEGNKMGQKAKLNCNAVTKKALVGPMLWMWDDPCRVDPS